MKRFEWRSAGGRTFAVYAPDLKAARRRFARIGRHDGSAPVRPARLGPRVDVQDERRAPGA